MPKASRLLSLPSTSLRLWLGLASFAFLATTTIANAAPDKKTPAPAPAANPADGTNVALIDMGATAKGTGPGTDRGWAWPAEGALQAKPGRGGMLFGVPPDGIKGGRIDIRLIMPVDIKAVEVVPLDYHGTMQPKGIDILVDDKVVKHVDLENKPMEPARIPVDAHGQVVSIIITDCYPPPTGQDGKPTTTGGWSRVRVYSTTDVASQIKPVDNFNVPVSPSNIEVIAGKSSSTTTVTGEPRNTEGHPNTLWDKQDIAHYKEMLKSNKELQAQLEGLKKSLDIRMTQPLGIPQPEKNPDGSNKHFSDAAPSPAGGTYGSIHNQLALDIANFGEVYQLTGEQKYADFAKKLLLAYADAVPNYGIGARPGFNHAPSIVFDQVLGDDTWLVPVARGYDLIHDDPSITPEERKHIEDDLLKLEANYIIKNHSMLEASTNWAAFGTCAVLTVGYATDDQDLINTAFYGIKGTKDKPTGGLFDRHFSDKAITPDGLWVEGAMGYQFMAMQALVMDAEMLWHHGIDMYRYRDGAFKRLFDSPLEYSYPDLTTPALHDSHHGSIIGTDGFLYEYAYRRYHDPRYIPILNQVGMHLDAHFQQFPVSVLYDRDKDAKGEPAEWKSINFFDVGYGILRNTTPEGTVSALLEYGPAGSHGHPDKLTLDLFAFNEQLMMDPGCVWYEQPIYRRWFRTTLAHPTLVVDERDQIMCGANQVVYGSANGMGIERAWTQDAYPGVTMDRSVFMNPKYVADIFGAFTRLPRKLDLAWHIRGDFASDLKLDPMTFPEPVENGYNELTDVRHTAAPTDKAWSASFTRKGNTARFLAAGGTPTEVIVGNGHYEQETPPTILERRTDGSTIYGNVIDISNAKDGYVKGVTQEGNIDLGYGLLKVATAKGTDLCFASYRPGAFKADGLETDALQAYVMMDGKNVQALYLGGGKTMKVPGGSLERSDTGLAYLEKAENGGFILANPSSSDTTVTVNVPALAGMETFNLDANGKRTGPANVSGSGSVAVPLKAGAKVEFAPKGAQSIYDLRVAMLQKRQADMEAALAKAHDDCVARTKTREAEAKAKPVPANTIVAIPAASFTGQGGGEVSTSDKKRGVVGQAILKWNDSGHWIEWTVDAPVEGYYNLSLCYCSELDQIQREITINGEVQEPFAPIMLPSTGGWSNGSDDWRLFTAMNPTNKQPLLIKLQKGKNVLRLTNMNDKGANVNYLAVTSPDVKPTREQLAGQLQPITAK